MFPIIMPNAARAGWLHAAATSCLTIAIGACAVAMTLAQDQQPVTNGSQIFAKENLVAWCIVPFDGKQRGPAERAAMCVRLGLKKIAYDWRDEHISTFEEEILEYKKRGLEYFAFWGSHDHAFRLFEKHGLHPQIWSMFDSPAGLEQDQRVQAAANQLLPLVERTRKLGSKLGLYNHGGWSGQPENMLAVCRFLRENHDAKHVGIVYNLHHAHDRIDDFAAVIKMLRPYLLCLNLNGMTRDAEKQGSKILPLGQGEFDVSLLKTIRDSGYRGPIGIIGHTDDDVQQRLQDNLDGLDWILPQLDGKPAGPKPKLRTWPPKIEGPEAANVSATARDGKAAAPPIPPENRVAHTQAFSQQLVAELATGAQLQGNAARGLLAFSDAKSACLSCHKLGMHGGTVGPDLSQIGKQRNPTEIVEAILWPNRQVEPEYLTHVIVTDDGRSHRGTLLRESKESLVLRDPTKGPQHEITIPVEEIEFRHEVGTLMPDNLTAAMTRTQLGDLLHLLMHLGRPEGLPLTQIDSIVKHAVAHSHGPAAFPIDRKPLQPKQWPSWQHHVNRDRIYDFYAKQANHFRTLASAGKPLPALLAAYPGLDGGALGHWGNQNEKTWSSDLWNSTDRGTLQSGVFQAAGKTVARGVCVRLGDRGEMACCFNPDTLAYEAVWVGGFLKTSSFRHGFLHGLLSDGNPAPIATVPQATEPFEYRGFYRVGKRIVFSFRKGKTEYFDSPWVKDGKFVRTLAPVDEHPLRDRVAALSKFSERRPRKLQTPIVLGTDAPYAVDTIELPLTNPWNALFFAGGHGFLPDGSALVCTMQGDVWRVSGFDYPSTTASWTRFASGLHHPQGMVVDDDGIFVLGRDQITRLHDLNHDGEADFYECFSNAYETSSAGHDFVCGLIRDQAGQFYTASGNQGIVRISADGKHAEVVATGLRNPDGLGLTADGLVTAPCSEGSWTPASMICAFRPDDQRTGSKAPFFGYGGPRNNEVPSLPLAYLPRGLDNSAAGQTTVTSDRWGPLQGQLLHFSFGAGSHFLVLRDQAHRLCADPIQGAVVPLPGEFASGAHRGKFSPHDGQLYVSGMQGWGSYTPQTGCFQRVRYTGEPVQLPVGFRVYSNGVWLNFSQPIDPAVAASAANHFAQCWNYRYSQAYGSPEYSANHFGVRGHDTVTIRSAQVVDQGTSLFLEIPDLQPVNQLHLQVQVAKETFRELFVTVHQLPEKSFHAGLDVASSPKQIDQHPILRDLALATRSAENPFREPIEGARAVKIETGTNLSYATRSFRVTAGEPIALTLSNPDVVPHNLAIVKPDTLQRVGGLANKLISDPEAVIRHYIPQTSDVLAYTDVVGSKDQFTIYFNAPEAPGRYPYLCTFPGHWLIMNGEMIVHD